MKVKLQRLAVLLYDLAVVSLLGIGLYGFYSLHTSTLEHGCKGHLVLGLYFFGALYLPAGELAYYRALLALARLSRDESVQWLRVLLSRRLTLSGPSFGVIALFIYFDGPPRPLTESEIFLYCFIPFSLVAPLFLLVFGGIVPRLLKGLVGRFGKAGNDGQSGNSRPIS